MALPSDESESTGDPEASPSPRTELLSNHPNGEPTDRVARPKRERDRRYKDRERVHSSSSHKDLIRLLVQEERESGQVKKVLYDAFDRLDAETRRASEAEQRTMEAIQRLRVVNEARLAALQEVAKAKEELRLYQVQLDTAQNEILRAQEIVDQVEAQRNEAEKDAARTRVKARRLHEERLIELARAEGRRQGLREGIERGREMGYNEANAVAYEDGRMRTMDDMDHGSSEDDDPDQADPEHQAGINTNGSPRSSRGQGHNYPEPLNTSTPPIPPQRASVGSRLSNSETPLRSASGPTTLQTLNTTGVPDQSHSLAQVGPVAAMTSAPSGVNDIHPTIVHHIPPSPRHIPFQVPPLGWIPLADEDSFISLPPPHEMSIPPPTPKSPAIPLQTDPSGIRLVLSGSEPPLRSRDFAYNSSGFAAPHNRAPSDSSLGSTALSQLDLVTNPNVNAPLRGHRDRPGGLPDIPEAISAQPSPVDRGRGTIEADRDLGSRSRNSRRDPDNVDRKRSPRIEDQRYSNPNAVEEWRSQADDTRSLSSQRSMRQHTSPPVIMPAPVAPIAQQGDLANYTGRMSDVYRRPRSRSIDSRSNRSSTASPDVRRGGHRRVVSSSSSVPEITIQPPSRPASNTSKMTSTSRMHMLSPDHANRPLPMDRPPSRHGDHQAQSGDVHSPAMISSTTGTPPAVPLPGGQFQPPPGFVPTGFSPRLASASGLPFDVPLPSLQPLVTASDALLSSSGSPLQQPMGSGGIGDKLFNIQNTPSFQSHQGVGSDNFTVEQPTHIHNLHSLYGADGDNLAGIPPTTSSGRFSPMVEEPVMEPSFSASDPLDIYHPMPNRSPSIVARDIPARVASPMARVGTPRSNITRTPGPSVMPLYTGGTPVAAAVALHTGENPTLRRSTSKTSVYSDKRFSPFDGNNYVDAAYLVSGGPPVQRTSSAAGSPRIKPPRLGSPALSATRRTPSQRGKGPSVEEVSDEDDRSTSASRLTYT